MILSWICIWYDAGRLTAIHHHHHFLKRNQIYRRMNYKAWICSLCLEVSKLLWSQKLQVRYDICNCNFCSNYQYSFNDFPILCLGDYRPKKKESWQKYRMPFIDLDMVCGNCKIPSATVELRELFYMEQMAIFFYMACFPNLMKRLTLLYVMYRFEMKLKISPLW